ncbi:dihydrolipoyl dehydrogenase [Wohlfahrtiimonas chitiniclastica]|uniref:dihydrolipoyl dehydrogenase n=1 Tax=Wohlfahrtiimonas chitiniclastica TaxID=400946 RepID=UPI0007BE7A9D|nr:dihydrolipoamide dehydrogenase [Wohlfahrtiimonas chitiniclastica]MBS7816024.1 dihydrolipoyl dehydrogenase [Wohlfahrtiimonas chitiniclastica]MBS7821981.1 dihydrolipoyl dehydrogenase [Wohlfahrtiimonas chitiniclastica]MBS7829773.1 dihydrolipoyl dehydrogenase [Wohlfahrtiimonas chitiniclastica]MBS7831740.1 dihydrolipoyl dehydrogenase [Wohlfahrtiimonas chitiniclastica]
MAIEIKIPNIGNFDAVDVIDVLVNVGDVVSVDQNLLTLESDKASMDVPSDQAGKITEILVKVGDQVKEGDTIAMIEPASSEDTPKAQDTAASAAPEAAPSAASSVVDIIIPNIGNFEAVDVIDVAINVGDTIHKDQNLVTLESDKASMDVPSEIDGTITEVLIKVGDQVKEGVVIARAQVGAAPTTAQAAPKAEPKAETIVEPAAATAAPSNVDCDVVVIGAGPGGYSAAFRAADLGLKVALIERYSTLGGVCLNVGCIPSKALLHVVKAKEEAEKHLKHAGIYFDAPRIELDEIRNYKSSVVSKLTGGLAAMAKMRKVDVIQGVATFKDDHHLTIQLSEGGERTLSFDKAIIAAGSRAIHLPFMPEDPRIIDSTGALELREIPKRMLVIGGGIIGLEMATVYSNLGANVEIVEFTEGFIPGADRDLTKIFEKYNKDRFTKTMFKTKVVGAEALPEGIKVSFEGDNAPSEPQVYDYVLVAIGRAPNGLTLNAENAGVNVTDRGFINVDKQMRTNVGNIFAIGDIVGQPMLAHKAVHEAHVAAEVCAGHKRFFDIKQIPSVAYTDPEISWAGLTETEAKAQGIAYEKAVFPWSASGKALASSREEGMTKLIFDPESKTILGGAVVGINAGDLIGEIALAVEMCADVTDIAHTIHPHPTLIESVGMAAEVAEGACTDLPPAKKK